MLLGENMVGNEKACKLVAIEKLKFEEENSLFAKFPIGATMQNGGKRKEVLHMTVSCFIFFIFG